MLILAAASALIYLLLAFKGWGKQAQRSSKRVPVDHHRQSEVGERPEQASPDAPQRSYVWGLAFAVLFYYGFLIWWARYGLGRAVKLTLACIAMVGLLQLALRSAGMIDIDGIGESIAAGLFIAVPIRAVAGVYVAKHDNSWRRAIVAQRNLRIQAAKK